MVDPEQLYRDIRNDYERTQSYRKTGARFGLNSSMARLICKGYKPGKKIRELLGLPPISSVVVVLGAVPEGALTISAKRCSCGNWFIGNTPNRDRCFICSPYKGKGIL